MCCDYEYDLLNMEIMPDHLHLFISAEPSVAPMKIEVFKKFPNLKHKKFWGSGLWSKGYFVGTAGTVTAETIHKYINEQKQ